MNILEKTYNTQEVAYHFGVSLNTIYNLIGDGKFVGVIKVGRKYLFTQEVLENYYKQNS